VDQDNNPLFSLPGVSGASGTISIAPELNISPVRPTVEIAVPVLTPAAPVSSTLASTAPMSEENEHGTHILGIIAAIQDNGTGIDGMNDDAPIWLGRAIGSGKWVESLVEFVDQARQDEQPNAVVNLSLDLTQKNPDGTISIRYEFTPEERRAIEYARQNGVLIVAAAGNEAGVMSVLGQASQEFDNIITVGAANGRDRAFYSSYGAGLNILAPGGLPDALIASTVADGLGGMAGTSVATAEVTGAISQVWAANPQLSYRQVIEILKQTATDLKETGWDAETGAGLLDLPKAVERAQQTQPEVYQPIAWVAPNTWSGAGTLPQEERAARGGTSKDQAFFMPAVFSDSDTLSAAVPKRYYKVYVDKPGYYEWTVTRTNGTASVPPAGLVDGNGKRARHRFIPGGGAIGSVTASMNGGSVPTSVTSGEFIDPGIYYLEVGGSVGSAASYTIDTKWIPDKATIATAGNAVFNSQVRISDRQDQYQPFATGTTNRLNGSGTVTYKFGDDSKQYANYSFEVSEPGQLSFNLNSPNGRSVVNVKKFVGQSNQAVTVGSGEFSPTSTGNSVLNLNPGRYEVEVTTPNDLWTDPDGKVAFQSSLAQGNPLLFVVNRPYTLNATFARTAPKPGEGKVPSSAGVLTETVSSNGVTTHYYENGYLMIQPSGVATWYSKGLWATVTPVNPVGQNLPTTPTVNSAPPVIPTPMPTPISDPDRDETMAKARSLSYGVTLKNSDGSEYFQRQEKIGGSSDINDWYKFTVPQLGIYKFTLDGLGQGAKYALFRDFNNNQQPDSGDMIQKYRSSKDVLQTIERILQPGTYYLNVQPSSTSVKSASDYKLSSLIEPQLQNGVLLRDKSDEKIYIMENGKRRWIPDPQTFAAMGLNMSAVRTFPSEELGKVSSTKPLPSRKDGSLLRYLGDHKVYIMENGKRRWIPDPETFAAMGLNVGAVSDVSLADVNAISENNPLPSRKDGTLLRYFPDGRVYIMENGKRRWIPDEATFNKMRLSWSDINDVSIDDLNKISLGQDLLSLLNPSNNGGGGVSGSVKPETLALIEKYDRVYSNSPMQPGHTGEVFTGTNYIALNGSPEFAEMWSKLFETDKPPHTAGSYLDHYANLGPGSVHNNTYHAGIDLSVPSGTPVKTLVGGEVIYVGTWDGKKTSSGNPMYSGEWGTIAIYNADLKQTFMYLHMDTSNFSEGDSIAAGQVIGLSGTTGGVPPHLHLEVKPTPSKPVGNDVKGLLPQYRKDWRTVQDLTDNPLTAFLVARDKGLTEGHTIPSENSGNNSEYQVDWNLISVFEGGAAREGYVPWPTAEANNDSGVTIATGFDLGQYNEDGLRNMGLSPVLTEKLRPYLGRRRQDAKNFLSQHPLFISSEEVFEIDKASKSKVLRDLEIRYNSESSIPFKSLPEQAQTTIASMAFQFGTYGVTLGTFWPLIVKQRWRDAVQVLRGETAYVNRRNQEADRLEQIA
jgi:hypothetical protein